MKHLLLYVFLTIGLNSVAQNLQFNDKGQLVNVDTFKKVLSSYTISRNAVNHLDAAKINEIKQALAARIQTAINNMQDDSLSAKTLYANLWGDNNTTNNIIQEMIDLRAALLGTAVARVVWNYVPSPTDINTVLNQDIFNLPASTINIDNKTASLIYTDPFKSWLLQYFNTSVSTNRINNLNMDIAYKNGWRELEQSYAQINNYLKITSAPDTITDCSTLHLSDINDSIWIIQNSLNTNYVINLLRTNNFFKQWLWYTRGLLQVNPLGVTTGDREYPVNERNSFDTSKSKLTNAQEADSLKNFRTTKQIQNKITLPILSSVADKNQTIYTWNYNGAKDFETNTDNKLKLIEKKEGLAYTIYNIPQNTGVKIDFDTSIVLDDRSKAVITVDNLFDQIGGLAAKAPDLLKHWANVSSHINTGQPAIPNEIITSSQAKNIVKAGKGLGNPLIALQSKEKGNFFQLFEDVPDAAIKVKEAEEKNYLSINNRQVPIAKDNNIDKRNILLAYLREDDNDECSDCNTFKKREPLITAFLEKDECYFLDYSSPTTIEKSAENLLPRFTCFIDEVNDCREAITNAHVLLQAFADIVKPYINITERSLPPVNLTEITDQTPVYTTKSAKLPMPESPKVLQIKVQPSVKNSKGEDSALAVVTTKFKAAPLHYVDLSVGISYFTSSYLVNEQGGDSSLPTSKNGDRFKLIAGIHIYPGGLFNIDDKFIHHQEWYHRTSIFAGVGLQKALDNFFIGASYDLVPGMRITIGPHIYKDTRFKIINSQVLDKASAPKVKGIYLSFNLEPVSFIKFLGLF